MLQLLQGNLGAAASALESAAREAPGESALLSDLSAIYSERATARESPEAAPKLRITEAQSAGIELPRSLRVFELLRVLDRVRPLGEVGETAAVENRMADSLQEVGQPGEAWRFRYRCLAWASRLGAGQHFTSGLATFESAARDALRQGRPEAALDFLNQALKGYQQRHQAEEIIRVRLKCSRIQAALGRREEAKRDYGEALHALELVPVQARPRLAGLLDVAHRDIEASEDRVAALASELLPSQPLDAQASLDFRRGDTSAAEAAIAQALAEIEIRRAKLTPRTFQTSFFDQARPLYERMIALQLHLGKPEKALDVLERFRARTLLDQLNENRTPAVGSIGTPLTSQDLAGGCQNTRWLLFMLSSKTGS
jgi:tetratricopeptide (TPR) repeat protein